MCPSGSSDSPSHLPPLSCPCPSSPPAWNSLLVTLHVSKSSSPSNTQLEPTSGNPCHLALCLWILGRFALIPGSWAHSGFPPHPGCCSPGVLSPLTQSATLKVCGSVASGQPAPGGLQPSLCSRHPHRTVTCPGATQHVRDKAKCPPGWHNDARQAPDTPPGQEDVFSLPLNNYY